MKAYNNQVVLFLFLVYVFSSCDPVSTYKTYVKNNSNSNLKVVLYSNKTLNPDRIPYDSIIVRKGNTELLKSSSQKASAEVCTNKKDSIAVVVYDNPSLMVTKNLNLEDNYQSQKKGNSLKGHTIKCEITITDADIVPK